MMSENKSYRVEYHFPRKCRSTNTKKKMAGLLTRIKLFLYQLWNQLHWKKKPNKQTLNQTNNNLKNSKKYNKEQIGSFGFGHASIKSPLI